MFYLVARNAIAAVLVGVGLPATLVAAVIITLSWPHSEKYPEGPVTSIEPLTTFADFPIYWLGRTYNGLDLTQIHTQAESPHSIVILTYGYGVCTSRGLDEHCSGTPILLIVEPACGVPRAYYQRNPDDYAWTPDVSINVEGNAPPARQDFLRDLALVNVSKFPDAKVVDSITYDTKFRSRCGDAPAE